MGYYINMEGMQAAGKADFIFKNVKGARFQSPPPDEEGFDYIMENGFIPVCVVGNGIFDAAGFCFSWDETQVFIRPDGRPRSWLVVPTSWAVEHSPGLAITLNETQ